MQSAKRRLQKKNFEEISVQIVICSNAIAAVRKSHADVSERMLTKGPLTDAWTVNYPLVLIVERSRSNAFPIQRISLEIGTVTFHNDLK